MVETLYLGHGHSAQILVWVLGKISAGWESYSWHCAWAPSVNIALETNFLGGLVRVLFGLVLASTFYLELAKRASFFHYKWFILISPKQDKVNNQGSFQNYLQGERKASQQWVKLNIILTPKENAHSFPRLLKFGILVDILHLKALWKWSGMKIFNNISFKSMHLCGHTQICNYSVASQMPWLLSR